MKDQNVKIRFFFDCGAGCLWPGNDYTWEKFGSPVDPKRLNLNGQIIDLMNDLQIMFDDLLNPIYPGYPSLWTEGVCKMFNKYSKKLFAKISEALPESYDLVNQNTEDLHQDPELIEYLSNPKLYDQKKGIS